MKKIIHKKLTIYYIFIPIIIITLVGIYAYNNGNLYDETILSIIIDQLSLPFYITIFGVVFSLYLENNEEKYIKNYIFQLRFIALSIVILIFLKLLLKNLL
ncbi:MAG: hypothetical protein WC850_01405 [Candidatus Gracilibacteria bacterium]